MIAALTPAADCAGVIPVSFTVAAGGICGALPVLKAGAHGTGAGGCACGVGDGDTGNLRHLTEKGPVGAALSMGKARKSSSR